MNSHLCMPKHQPDQFWWFSCSSVYLISLFWQDTFSVNNLFAQLFKLPLPRRIHLLLAGYVSQEDFQSSMGFPVWLWPRICGVICDCDRVCVNVHHRRWAEMFRCEQPPAGLGCPGTVPEGLFYSHSTGQCWHTGQGASNGLQHHFFNLISPLPCYSLKWKLTIFLRDFSQI